MKRFISLLLLFILVVTFSVCAEETPLDVTRLTLNVSGSPGGKVYRIDTPSPQNYTTRIGAEIMLGTEIKLEARETTGTFMYWKEFSPTGKDRVLSYDPVLTMTLLQNNLNLQAMFQPPLNEASPSGYVTFFDSANKVLTSGQVPEGTSAREPTASTLLSAGYEFSGWDTDAWKSAVGGEFLFVRACYEKKDVAFTVDVSGGSIRPEKDTYAYDEKIYLTADEPAPGKVFAGWLVNGEQVSFTKNVSLYVACDLTAEALYADEGDAPTPTVLSAMLDASCDAVNGAASFLTLRNVPADCELVESGILTAAGNYTGALTVSSTAVRRTRTYGTERFGLFRYNRNLGEGKSYRARAYVIFKKEGSLYVAYSREARLPAEE